MPSAFQYLWHWYMDLSASRPSSGMGISPIAWAEIEAYSRLMGISIKSWEADTLRRIDAAVVGGARAKASASQPNKSGKVRQELLPSELNVRSIASIFGVQK